MTEFPFRRWPEFERLFDEALELGPSEREAFLDRECRDQDLRAALEAHLDAEARSRTIFGDDASPPWAHRRNADTAARERWLRIQELFEEAGRLDGEERERFLATACRRDPGLATEVRSLLAAVEGSETFLEGIARSAGMPMAERGPSEPDFVGTRLGAWRVVRPLGRGGSSAVYAAERADGGFSQRAAVKVLSPSLLPRESIARFHRERQILAGLEHPNIARLLDGGMTDEGWPYIVMELVEGEPIDAYCDRHRLSVEDRLRLFVIVCRAVQHAHGSLIVHRDLKPANILVAEDGTVKLLDFGIAKLLGDPWDPADDLQTRTGVHPMTPAFASPEQIAGKPVTTATDVFQLGAVLHLLLTGRHAFGGETGWAGLLARTERAGVAAPSARVTRPGGSGGGGERDPGKPSTAEMARRRGTTPERLRRTLRGDLDTLVLTSLRTDPSRRYPTAEALARDLERYLSGEPLAAHPDSIAYRVGKFLRRHPVGSFATMAAVAVLTVLSVRLAAEYRRAESERAKAEEVTAFLLGIFQRADPEAAFSDTLTAVALLEEGAASVRARLGDQPDVRATLEIALGQAFLGLGRTGEAEEMIASGLETRRRILPPGDFGVGEALLALGQVRIEGRDFAGALASLHEAEEVFRGARSDGAAGLAQALGARGLALQSQGNRSGARDLYEEALALFRSQGLPPSRAYTELLSNLAWLEDQEGRHQEAVDLFRELVTVRQTLFGPDHSLVGYALSGQVAAETHLGALDSATIHAEMAVRITRNALGDDHLRTASALIGRAGVGLRTGRVEEALSDYRDAMEIVRSAAGENSPDLARIRNDMGIILRNRGDLAGSETYLRGAISAYSVSLGPAHLFTGIAWHNLAMTLAAAGDTAEARESYRTALEIIASQEPPLPVRTARTLTALGSLEVETGRHDDGDPLLRRALGIWEASDPGDPIQLAATRAQLGRSLLARGRASEAEPLLVEAYSAMREIGGETHPVTRRVAGWVADLHAALGRAEEADRFRALSSGG